MARKNNKNKKKQYVEWLKEIEKEDRMKRELRLCKKLDNNCNKGDILNKRNQDVEMKITKVKKKNIKLDKKGQRRLNKLLGKCLYDNWNFCFLVNIYKFINSIVSILTKKNCNIRY